MSDVRADIQLAPAPRTGLWLLMAAALAWHVFADVGGGDSGEIGGAAFALGVAHPTGFPLDMLVLRAFSLLPLGCIAWRQNLAVACMTALALYWLVQLVWRLARMTGVDGAGTDLAAALFALAVALTSTTLLGSAVCVEVYSTALACGLAAVVFALDRRRFGWSCSLFGLALAAHVTAALSVGVCLLFAMAQRGRSWLRSSLVRAPAALACALCIAYLPLAAQRSTAFDWGDPHDLQRLWLHLSAARIREAYSAQMFAGAAGPARALLGQLLQRPWLLAPGLGGVLWLWLRARPAALLLGALLCVDLGYAVWVNPMGIGQRQVGHLSWAVLVVLSALGVAAALARACEHGPRLGRAVQLACVAVAAYVAGALPWPPATDGYLLAERYGSGSPLVSLAPRSVYLCANDGACASALFARYAEGVRPDLAVLPAQHLWDTTVVRRVGSLIDAGALLPHGLPAANRRAALARRVQAALVGSRQRRTIAFELCPLDAAGEPPPELSLRWAPFIELSADATPRADAAARLRALERARFGAHGPATADSRRLWSRAHSEVAKAYLASNLATARREFERAVLLTPDSASAHSNLGVALQRAGDFAGALRETRAALTLEPRRATAWVNLAELMLRTTGPAAARTVIEAAHESDVRDRRLSALERGLQGAQ